MKFFTSPLFIVVALALAAFFSYGSVRSYIRNYNINKEISALEQKQATLEKERSDLSSLLKQIQSDTFVEQHAREQLGLRMPGEKTVVIQHEEDEPQEMESQAVEQELTNPQRWWNYFFAKKPAG